MKFSQNMGIGKYMFLWNEPLMLLKIPLQVRTASRVVGARLPAILSSVHVSWLCGSVILTSVSPVEPMNSPLTKLPARTFRFREDYVSYVIIL